MAPEKDKRIAMGSDHAGFPLKEALREELSVLGYAIDDFGAYSTDSVDYPDIAKEVGSAVVGGKHELGILICGTGIGITIAANKVKGVRAAACSDCYSAKMAREHNNSNILGMGARVVGIGLAKEIALRFLESEFEVGSRHERRVNKICSLEEYKEG